MFIGMGLRNSVFGKPRGAIYNQLKTWISSARSTQSGSSYTRILEIGNSTLIGFGVDALGARPNESKAFANQLSPKISSAHDDAFFGFSNASGNRITKDPRISNSGAVLGSVAVLGGVTARLATTGNYLRFTPETTCDTFRVYFWYNGSLTYSIQATGGTALTGTLTSGSGTVFGTSTLKYFEVSAASLAPGNNVTITKTGGTGAFEIAGIEARNSTIKQVIVYNAGVYGSKSADWIVSDGGGRKPLDLINTMPSGFFSAVTVKAGINDAGSSIVLTTYKSNIQTLINGIIARGLDCVLETDNPVLANNTQPYIDALKELADTNNLLLINSHDAWGTYTYANSQGWMMDTQHPNSTGYINQATYKSTKFLSVI